MIKKVTLHTDGRCSVSIGAHLTDEQEKALMTFLKDNTGVFAWETSDLTGVPLEVVEHHLTVCPQVPLVKDRIRHQSQEKQDFICSEVRKLKKPRLVHEVLHPT
jgi:hypothetical protein